jgi:hypothetical protein
VKEIDDYLNRCLSIGVPNRAAANRLTIMGCQKGRIPLSMSTHWHHQAPEQSDSIHGFNCETNI